MSTIVRLEHLAQLLKHGALLPLACLMTMLAAPASQAAEKWELGMRAVPYSHTDDLVHAEGIWVGVGVHGKIITSDDGVNWEAVYPLTEHHLRSITHANGRFVACGDKGILLQSDDGLDWQVLPSPSKLDLLAIEFGAGVFVINARVPDPDANVYFLTSPDLVTWTSFNTKGKYSHSGGYVPSGKALTYGDGKFLIPITHDQVFISEDGFQWTGHTVDYDFGAVQAATYSAGIFHCIGRFGTFASSEDGIHWTQQEFVHLNQDRLTSVFADGKRLIVTTEYSIRYSTDGGLTWGWSTITAGTWESGFSSMAKGDDGYVVMTYDGTSLRSTDFTWPQSTLRPRSQALFDLHHGANTFVAVGRNEEDIWKGLVKVSSDGITWTDKILADGTQHSVCHGNGTWVCAGANFIGGNAFVYTSTDLATWTVVLLPEVATIRDLAYGNGQFVAVGEDWDTPFIFTSPDGITWTERTSNSRGPLERVTFAGGRFFSIGYYGTFRKQEVLTSTDGILWSPLAAESLPSMRCIAHGSSGFLAASSGNRLMRSPDGLNWSPIPSAPDTTVPGWNDLIHDGTQFVGVPGGSRGATFSSDGETWTPQIFPIADLKAVAAGNGKVVAINVNTAVSRAIVPLPEGPAANAESASVTWTPAAGARGYQLYRRLVGSIGWTDAAPVVAASETRALLAELLPDTAYEYAIQTHTGSGLSSLTRVNATTFNDLDMWKVTHFGSRSATGPGADDANPDNDAYPNLVEYALNGNPHEIDGPALLEFTQEQYFIEEIPGLEGTGLHYFLLSFAFMNDARKTGITTYVESSPDLQDWTRLVESIGGQTLREVSTSGGYYYYDGYPSSPAPRRGVTVTKEIVYPPGGNPGKHFLRYGAERRAP